MLTPSSLSFHFFIILLFLILIVPFPKVPRDTRLLRNHALQPGKLLMEKKKKKKIDIRYSLEPQIPIYKKL
jgi:hypothetical protein